METFPLGYDFKTDIDETNKYTNRTITFESGKKQKQGVSANKAESWQITCKGTLVQRKILKDFHDAMHGDLISFYFYTPDNEQVVARFSDGNLPVKDIRELDITKPTYGNIVGFTCTCTIEKVI